MDELPTEMRPKTDNYFYKRHRDHTGFKAPPDASHKLPSQKDTGETSVNVPGQPVVTVEPPSK